MKHVEQKCQLGPDKCADCDYDTHSELFLCDTCGGSEGTLTSECPGRKITGEEEGCIFHGALDFIDGAWKGSYYQGRMKKVGSTYRED